MTRDEALKALTDAGYAPLPWQMAFHTSPRPIAVGDIGAGKTEVLLMHALMCALQDRGADGVLMFCSHDRARQMLERWVEAATNAGITLWAGRAHLVVEMAGGGKVVFTWPARAENLRGRVFAWGGVDGIDQCGGEILDRVRAGERHRFATVSGVFEPIACAVSANTHLPADCATGHTFRVA